jgi:hypothetical protein
MVNFGISPIKPWVSNILPELVAFKIYRVVYFEIKNLVNSLAIEACQDMLLLFCLVKQS